MVIPDNKTMKFSIVTPSYNCGQYIEETIKSVVTQKGDFSIEYIIIDKKSTDHTIDIVNKYVRLLESGKCLIACNDVTITFISEEDDNLYEGINRGFSRASGDIFAWINADDVYMPGAFNVISRCFDKRKDIHWLKGITSYIDESSNITSYGKCHFYNQEWLKQGVYGRDLYFVQQDSVFWRDILWKKIGSGIDTSYNYAGDYWLWTAFAEHAELYSLNARVSCFRERRGQLSESKEEYMKEVLRLRPRRRNTLGLSLISNYYKPSSFITSFIHNFVPGFAFGNQEYQLVLLDDQGKPVYHTGKFGCVSSKL